MNTEVIMGLPVDQVTYQTILAELPLYFENGKKMTAISINPQIAVDAKKYLSNKVHIVFPMELE